MNKKLLVICLLIATNLYSQGPLKKRVIMHQLEDKVNTLLAEIGAENMKQAQRKIKKINELLGYLQVSTISKALNKVKQIDTEIYEKEKQNEKLLAQNKSLKSHNKQIIAQAGSMQSRLQNIIDARTEYTDKHQTHLDISIKKTKKLPRVRKK